MKSILAFIALASVSAQAAPSIKASDYTCDEIQEFVADHGSAFIVSGPFGGGNTIVADRSYCQRDEVTNSYYVSSSDKRFCLAGRVCKSDGRYGN